MDDTFDQLDQAAVAGAEGTTWPIPELSHPTHFPVFDSFAVDDEPTHVSFQNPTTVSFHPPPPSTPISIPIPIPASSLKTEPTDTSMTDTPPSPSFSATATTPSVVERARSHVPSHPSRAFEPIRTPRKKRAAAINELSKSPTSIAIHSIDDDSEHVKEERRASERKIKHNGGDSSNDEDTRDNNMTSSKQGSASLHDTPMRDASPTTSGCTPLSPHDLVDLSGTTAARSRKMTEDERKIMLHKRRLRNRASAARSREKRSRTLNELTTEVEDLMMKSARLAEQASQAVEEARKLRAKNFMLMKENELLKSELKL